MWITAGYAWKDLFQKNRGQRNIYNKHVSVCERE